MPNNDDDGVINVNVSLVCDYCECVFIL